MNVVQYSIEPLLRVAQAFPATPRIMADLGRLLRDPGADLKDVVKLLKSDSALVARILRVANSAAIGAVEHVAAIEEAAALIGFREIHRLVGAVAIDQFSLATYPLYGVPGARLRANALFVALIMEELALTTRRDPHAAYTTGLLRSVGKLALEKLADPSARPFQPTPGADLVAWEKHTFGISANEATAAILHQWRFPAGICQAIARHFWPTDSGEPLADLLNLAASCTEQLGHGLPGEQRYWMESAAAFQRCGVDAEQCQRAVDRAALAFEQLSRMIG
ncbi:HDOD domain-containing protein [Opitutus terrae]|uniref:Putative signal transduction protein n=1 Tax=Opitutus terrae (strain DSM 11246 / JCM 15787 / PB90-1) TaxID=452637 RepID=B1ZV25_OPITP|nr:HDOD domain-containing protein [Opitutus terrae]ACB75994.1 putative signal transduction protein [Opitutus terrae PB90-1]